MQRKPRKTRDVWIAFAGRIVAQFIGATSSVVLGLFLLHRHQATDVIRAEAAQVEPAVAVRRASEVRTGPVSVAVQPLRDVSDGAAAGGFAGALTDAVIVDLVRTAALRVTSRPAGVPAEPALAAPATAADYVLEGSVLVAGRQVRVTIALVESATGELVWAESYHRPLQNRIALEDAIAGEIVRQVTAIVTAQPAPPAVERRADGRATNGVKAVGPDEHDAPAVTAPQAEALTLR